MINTYYLAPRARYDLATEARGIPLYLRFSYKGQQAWLATGEHIKKREHWHDKSKYVIGGVNFRTKNKVIEKYIQEANERLRQAILEGTGPNIHAFKGNTLISFEDYINEIDKSNCAMGLIKSIKLFSGKVQEPKKINKKELKKLLEKLKVPDISTITIQWLRKLENYMRDDQELLANSIKGYMMSMSKVMKQATKEGFISKCPIGQGLYEVPAAGETTPTYLVDEEREKVLNYFLNHKNKFQPKTYMALAYFAFGCYTGLRYSDWAVFDISKSIQANMIILRAEKNGNLVPKLITPDVERILTEIRKIGPLSLTYDQVLKELDTIQEILEFEKPLTTHVARHSFGYFCASRKVSMECTAYMMGISLKIVKTYYHYTGKHMEEEAAKLAA